MAESETIHNEELEEFKGKIKEGALQSISLSLNFFLFSQWLKSSCESKQERQKTCDAVFSQWFSQMKTASSPLFAGINKTLNEPKARWQGLVSNGCVSVEDYQQKFNEGIKEIKIQFDKVVN